ncbi:MAG: BON domain-containing protein [Mariprofundales bacterium]
MPSIEMMKANNILLKTKLYICVLYAIICLLSSGCLVTAIALSATAGASAANDERSIGRHLDDIGLATGIKSRLIADKNIQARWISVEVIEGHVSYTGYVADNNMQQQAIALARSIVGVLDVQSELQIGSPSVGEMANDSWVTAQVKTRLFKDTVTSGLSIHIETVNGMVYLQGIVANTMQKVRAQDLTIMVDGVSSVKNMLKVR